jgi:dienelactone hydrolase
MIVVDDADYRDAQETLRGLVAYDDSLTTKRPGIVVVHEAWGLGLHAIARARMLADLGYVALAADMYGDRRQATDLETAMGLIGDMRRDPAKLRARAVAAVAALAAHPAVDASRLAAIGFCFGGSTVLELARAGVDLKGVVSFHGGLETAAPAEPGAIKAKILVLTGADDPMIPPSQVVAFEEEMRRAEADWQVVAYGGTVHSFTNPEAGKAVALPGVAYHALADRRSWAAMRMFFDEIFADG